MIRSIASFNFSITEQTQAICSKHNQNYSQSLIKTVDGTNKWVGCCDKCREELRHAEFQAELLASQQNFKQI